MPALRVLAGTSLDNLVPINELVNSGKSHHLSSDFFDGQLVCHIKGFQDEDGKVVESEYFSRSDRQGITWSIQVQGTFLKPSCADDILFGNTFDRPLHLPWGSGAALKFMNYVDPTLENDLASSTRPWALSPLICTMPHFSHHRNTADSRTFPTNTSLVDDTKELHLTLEPDTPSSASSSSSSLDSVNSRSSKKSKSSFSKLTRKRKQTTEAMNLTTAGERQTFFRNPENRRKIVFGPEDVITTDFCYGFIEFSPTLSLRLPGGISFDLMRYWDGQPVRFVCCERKSESDDLDTPWGRILWCVVVEPVSSATT